MEDDYGHGRYFSDSIDEITACMIAIRVLRAYLETRLCFTSANIITEHTYTLQKQVNLWSRVFDFILREREKNRKKILNFRKKVIRILSL